MSKKWRIICTIILFCLISFYSIREKTKIVSCITTVDAAYMTVLLRGIWPADEETAAKKVIELYEKNGFANIKFSTDKELCYITIYQNGNQMSKGTEWFTIKYNFREKSMKIL